MKKKKSGESALERRLVGGFLRENFDFTGAEIFPFEVKGFQIEDVSFLGKGSTSSNDRVITPNFPWAGAQEGAFRPAFRLKLTDLSGSWRPEHVLCSAIGAERLMTEAGAALEKAGADTAAAKLPIPVANTIVLDNGTFHRLPPENKWRYFATISIYEREADTFLSHMQRHKGDDIPTEADLRALRNLAKAGAAIHRIKPVGQNDSAIQSAYTESLRFVLGKATAHHAPFEKHPLLSNKEIDRFYSLVRKALRKWTKRFARLARSWGDFNLTNGLVDQHGRAIPSDPRTDPGWLQWADPGVDVGWFFGELWWYACLLDSDFYRAMARLFLRFYEEESGDKRITEAVIIGLIWRCALRMNTVNSSDDELRHARPFVKDMWRWIEAGAVDL